MKIFTYNEYIKCIHTIRLNAVLQLAEEEAEYHLENKEKRKTQSELIKNILRNKEEAEKFINYFLKPKKSIKSEQLIKYTNNYIIKKYKSKEADLIYKLKDQEVYFLIEHQSTINQSISYKILNYCIDIMQERVKNNTKYPIVIPIVIYTGEEKWKNPRNYIIEYNLIEINKITKQTLLKQNTIFGKIMIIEKSKNKEELIDNLGIIIKTIKEKEKLNELSYIINYVSNNIINR